MRRKIHDSGTVFSAGVPLFYTYTDLSPEYSFVVDLDDYSADTWRVTPSGASTRLGIFEISRCVVVGRVVEFHFPDASYQLRLYLRENSVFGPSTRVRVSSGESDRGESLSR